ncbi:hypothetical protein HDV02_003010 [Globomyces sp. JEL0801]|nr:hypothetical protein HDV02_003010 [Globomyces sp. JEL0801]
MALLGGWPAFLIIWLTMICDMELLKLLQILTPFFTTDRIKVIQIIETIVSFGLGGGVLLWPFSDFDYAGLISKWYNFTILLQLISAMLVAIQCTYISIKMYQFAVRKKGQDGVKIRQKTYRAIFLVLLFLCNGLFIATAALVGALMSTTSDATTNRLSTLLYATSGIPTPIQILIYYHIFESIKGIKFERITPKKSVTVVN